MGDFIIAILGLCVVALAIAGTGWVLVTVYRNVFPKPEADEPVQQATQSYRTLYTR